MSVIKKSSGSNNSVKRSAPKPPAAKSEATKKPADSKPDSKSPETKGPEAKDPQGRKPETSETKPNGETKPTAETGQVDENGKPIEENKPSDEAKNPEDSFEQSGELSEEDKENAEMREEIQGLKDALAALYDMMGSEEEDKKEVAESPGGCCGKPSGAKKAGDSEGNQDWNSILAAGVAAVKAQNLSVPGVQNGNAAGGQGANNGNKSAGGGLQVVGGSQKAGAAGAAGNGSALGGKPAGAAGGKEAGADPLTKLASDYEKAKSAKAELKPEIENEVRSLLGLPVEEKNGAQAGGANPTAGLAMAS